MQRYLAATWAQYVWLIGGDRGTVREECSRSRSCAFLREVENGMNYLSEQSASDVSDGVGKAWTVPTLEKVEINETAAGARDVGGGEGSFPFLPSS